MADFVAMLAMCVLLPVAGATMLRMWQTRPPRRRHSGLAVGQIPRRCAAARPWPFAPPEVLHELVRLHGQGRPASG